MARIQQTYQCSFCGKAKEQVARLIAGPGGIYICDECVALSNEIITEERRGPPGNGESPLAPLPASADQQMAFVPAFGDRIFDALLALGYAIEVADDGAIVARCESTLIPAAPPRLVAYVEPDGALTWAESAVA